ncbi:MAG: DNA topoisomerase 3 [Waddliaceae bacterium]|nr:DNA topoisomerase 3 [Waddliaceae bacterium]MBT7264716.1 DNA topoisomerase 3 [Waddliaceae bacterium]
MAKVILAEKPSVGRDIAAFLGATKKYDGYLEGNGYIVTWAFGHLVTLKKPDEYDPKLKRWSLDTLPFIPETFKLTTVGNPGSKKQYGIIKKLFKSADEIICATDAGREGELIFRYILAMSGCEKKPIKRLWLNSLTEEAIKDAFDNLKPGDDYNNLYAAARCRSESDWIVGLNATRSYTVQHGRKGILWSVGRVQTPVLAMIARRDDDIRAFVPELFWELMTNYRDAVFEYSGKRFMEKDKAEDKLSKIQGHPFAITKVKTKKETVAPPMLYDLTELQRDMNRRYGMSAADTLKEVQTLYESKYITYPRTDSRFLTNDMKGKVPAIFSSLSKIKDKEISQLDLNNLPFSKRIVDNKKVTDHHAIIPTGKIPHNLSGYSNNVYDAIVTQTIAAFYPPCLKDITNVEGVTNDVTFKAKGVHITSPGWMTLFPHKKSDKQELPKFTVGESGDHKPYVKEGKTKPPKHFTENSLLGAMETAGKMVDDEELREALKEKGIGTPATRASIIETLISRKYIERSKKTLSVTNFGRYLYAIIQNHSLKSPELTGEWESKLREIEQGKLAPERFMESIASFTKDIIQQSTMWSVDAKIIGICPKCGKHIIEGRRGYGCSGWKEGCTFVLWKEYKTLTLRIAQARELLQRKILLHPVMLPEQGSAILCMTEKGNIIDISVPVSQRKPFEAYGKSRVRRQNNYPAATARATKIKEQ